MVAERNRVLQKILRGITLMAMGQDVTALRASLLAAQQATLDELASQARMLTTTRRARDILLRQALDAGCSYAAVAEAADISVQAVRAWARRHPEP